MRKYVRPVMYLEEFVANQSIAACGDVQEEREFECFRGPQNDKAHVFSSGVCSQVPVYYDGVTRVHSSYKTRTYSGASGVYAYCTRTRGSGYYTDGWVQSGSTLNHATSWGRDTHNRNYHCMAVAVYGDVEEFSNS